jgi:type 1 glutamine amidotransferase
LKERLEIMADKKKALIVKGGWNGHEPDQVGARFKKILENEGLEVTVADKLEAFSDLEMLMGLHLIVPIWTGGNLSGELCKNVSKAVAAGVGMAGNHGGMCDAFRENVEWQFITGGNWVSHPGGICDYTVEIRRNSSSSIVEGLKDFHVRSEQYYLHVDPAVEILATTRFPNVTYYHSANKAIDMPVVWTKKWGHGRVFYSSLGHTDSVFVESPTSEEIMRRGFLWAIEGRDIAIERKLDPREFENTAKMF